MLPGRLELLTLRLAASRSNQLGYESFWPKLVIVILARRALADARRHVDKQWPGELPDTISEAPEDCCHGAWKLALVYRGSKVFFAATM